MKSYDSYGPSLHGTPQPEPYYDTTLRCYRVANRYLLGRAYSMSIPAPRAVTQAQDARTKGDQLHDKVRDYLQREGPTFVVDIANDLQLKQSTVDTVLRRYPDEFRYSVTLLGGNTHRTRRLWEVVE